MRYTNYAELKKDFPDPCQLMDDENENQYPDTSFVEAVIGANMDEEGNQDMMALFDYGNDKELLWVWICGRLSQEDDSYIDEYYTVSKQDAHQYLILLENGEWES
jgi:hypothetical protein